MTTETDVHAQAIAPFVWLPNAREKNPAPLAMAPHADYEFGRRIQWFRVACRPAWKQLHLASKK